jgi:hypothetical protein
VWAEGVLYRELHGILQSLVSRPFSRGHDGAVTRCKAELAAICVELEAVPRELVAETHFRMFRCLISQLDIVPPEVVARSLLGTVGELLSRPKNDRGDFPRYFVARPPAEPPVRRLVVSSGPVVGLGDELLVARALVERVRCIGEVELFASTRHSDLWACLDGAVGLLSPPPFGAFEFLESLPEGERARTAYLFFDFLASDPLASPYAGPTGLLYAGRWCMGLGRGEFLHSPTGICYEVSYPSGLPASRWLESRWAAGIVIPGSAAAPKPVLWQERLARRGPRKILLQALTSKPSLTYPTSFYLDVLAPVVRECPDVELEFIPAPTVKGQAILADLARGLLPLFPPGACCLPEPMSIHEIFTRIADAVLLFGPDTFSAHLAAVSGTPQVTISMPEHRPWISVGSPCLAVRAERHSADVAASTTQRILAFLHLSRWRAPARLLRAADDWRSGLRSVDSLLTSYLWGGTLPCAAELAAPVRALQGLFLGHADELARWFAPNEPPLIPGFLTFDPFVYSEQEDLARALTRWYHTLCISEFTGLLSAV